MSNYPAHTSTFTSDWAFDDDGSVTGTVTIPPNCSGLVTVPASWIVSEGSNEFTFGTHLMDLKRL